MYEYRSLKILALFKPLFEKFQIDYPILQNILATKLLIDERRVPTIFDDAKATKKRSIIKSFWIYFLYGLILVFFVFGEAYMVQMSIIFGIALFILVTALIADFSPVMLDVRDQSIIGSKPINKRTIGLAKFIHILIYLLQLTFVFTIVPIIFMLFVQGVLFTTLFIVMLLFVGLFIIAFTSLIYIFVLRFFSGELLKSMINYVQIIFSIGIIIGYQIIIRSYGFIDLNAPFLAKGWHILLPPMWFAAPFELIINHNTSLEVIVLSFIAVIVPVVAFLLYYWLMPSFETDLQKLLETTNTHKNRKASLTRLWEGLLCRTVESRAYFQFIYKIVDREREFKLKVYPSLGIGLVLPFIFIFSEVGVRTFEEVTTSGLYFCIYLMHLFIGITIYTFQFSTKFKSAWLFTMTGENISKPLNAAVIKVFLAKIYLPMFIIVVIPYYLLFNQFQFIDAAIVFLSAVIQALLSYKITSENTLPFSMPFETAAGNDSIPKAILLMLLTIPFVLFHFLSTLLHFMSYGYFIILSVKIVLLWRMLFGKTKLV